MKKALLTIAGFDPTSGAGATLDLKVFHHFGFYGLAVLSAITIQSSSHVFRVKALSADLLLEQYRKLQADFKLSGLKLGMIGTGSNLRAVEEIISENQKQPRVVDPVFRSSSGKWLLEKKYISLYLQVLSGRITLITPNLDEASLLLERKIKTVKEMEEAARNLSYLTDSAALVKGGHLQDKAIDVLYDGRNLFHFEKKKLPFEVHGTGCFLSSAILCFLADGLSLSEACQKASSTIYHFIQSSIKISNRRLFDI